ncbi:hypothetical protein B0O80DRAFT_453299 [Mortierella sp. GBAus27b]|nr:hypothetical protein B0O80DRAFT_453299 [Mortierella sp. GBAus27b]
MGKWDSRGADVKADGRAYCLAFGVCGEMSVYTGIVGRGLAGVLCLGFRIKTFGAHAAPDLARAGLCCCCNTWLYSPSTCPYLYAFPFCWTSWPRKPATASKNRHVFRSSPCPVILSVAKWR